MAYFTHVVDIIEGMPSSDQQWTAENGTPASSSAPYAVYNIGPGSPIS